MFNSGPNKICEKQPLKIQSDISNAPASLNSILLTFVCKKYLKLLIHENLCLQNHFLSKWSYIKGLSTNFALNVSEFERINFSLFSLKVVFRGNSESIYLQISSEIFIRILPKAAQM